MNLSHFLAKRFTFTQSEKRKVPPIIKVASGGIALGVVIILLTISITLGYKKEIHEKLMGFNKHISLTSYETDNLQSSPISEKKSLTILKNIHNIKHITPYASLGAIAVASKETEAILLKGVTATYNWDFFQKHLTEGRCPKIIAEKKSNEIIISETLAKTLEIKTGDKLQMYFLQKPPRVRVFKIVGIFNTNISELDKHFVIADVRHIQKINQWNEDMYSGLEITLKNTEMLEETTQELKDKILKTMENDNDLLQVINTKKRYIHIFDWLNIMRVNVRIILSLIIIISSFNMISALLVIIIEKTRHIGVLKALGMPTKQIRSIFLYKAFYIIGKGLLWGNLIGVLFAILQKKFQVLTLNPDIYYLKAVPIDLNLTIWILTNLLIIGITLLIMLVPTSYIAKISPTKAIRIN